MSSSILTRRTVLSGGASTAAALVLGGCATGVPATQRDIGFDLWSGVPGTAFGSRVDKTVGSRRIRGPRNWRHPITGETLRIYTRDNRERNGVKTQYFTMRPDGTALARVFDRRPGQANDRYFIDDAFVPMGAWGDRTTRRYTMTQVQGGQQTQFRVTLRMLRANFTENGRSGSMEYDWILKTMSGRTVFHERYIFSPGVGFVDFDNRL